MSTDPIPFTDTTGCSRSVIKICHIDDIVEGNAKGFEAQGEKYLAIKKDNQLFVYKNSCPHLGIPLEWFEDDFLDSDKELIQCATHGALFVIDTGECVFGPCLGERLSAVKISVRNGEVLMTGNS